MGFQITAIVIMIAFYGCYFTKMAVQKKQGIQTDQIGKGKAGFDKFVEVTMKFAAFLVAGTELVCIFTGTGRGSVPCRMAGAVTGVAGTALFMTAVVTMRDSWRAGVSRTDKTGLVTNGIFQISRNPAFLGFDLLYTGILLMFFNRVLCVVTVFAIVMYHLQIVCVEEKFLTASFGNEYGEYRKMVCRYIGRKR